MGGGRECGGRRVGLLLPRARCGRRRQRHRTGRGRRTAAGAVRRLAPSSTYFPPPPPAPPAPLGLQAAAAAGDDCITIAARMRTGPCAKLQDSTMVRGGRGEGGRKGVDGDEGQGHAQPLDDPRPATPTPPGQDARDHRDGLPRARRVQGDDAGRARVVLPRPPLFHHPGAARGTPHAGAGGGRRGEARPDPKSSSHRAARARRM